MKNVAIIQARMGSSRLPGKVLRDVGGMTMIDRVVGRVKRCQFVDQVVVATSDQRIDQAIVDHCRDFGYSVFAGSHLNVLSRYVEAADLFNADRIIRITGDCPLIDSGVIDQVVTKIANDPFVDYACNFFPNRFYPRGLDVEILTLKTLKLVDKLAVTPAQREHVTLQIYQNPTLYSIGGVQPREDYSDLRWTVDTAEDLQLVNMIYQHFGQQQFDWRQVIDAWSQNPHWATVNQQIVQKKAA